MGRTRSYFCSWCKEWYLTKYPHALQCQKRPKPNDAA